MEQETLTEDYLPIDGVKVVAWGSVKIDIKETATSKDRLPFVTSRVMAYKVYDSDFFEAMCLDYPVQICGRDYKEMLNELGPRIVNFIIESRAYGDPADSKAFHDDLLKYKRYIKNYRDLYAQLEAKRQEKQQQDFITKIVSYKNNSVEIGVRSDSNPAELLEVEEPLVYEAENLVAVGE